MVRSVIGISSLAFIVAFVAGRPSSSLQAAEPAVALRSSQIVELKQPIPETIESSNLELGECIPRWHGPVAVDVVDTFRRPETRFTAGNRGLEFGTTGGELVEAVEAGDVVFAGPVGGRRFVVVLHPDGMKSTYAYLNETSVAAGAKVERGEVVGLAGTGFHLTARAEGRYLDPNTFLSSCKQRVRLVPTAGPGDRQRPVSRGIEPIVRASDERSG